MGAGVGGNLRRLEVKQVHSTSPSTKTKKLLPGVYVKTLSAPSALTEQKRAQSSLDTNIAASHSSFWPQETACEGGGRGVGGTHASLNME